MEQCFLQCGTGRWCGILDSVILRGRLWDALLPLPDFQKHCYSHRWAAPSLIPVRTPALFKKRWGVGWVVLFSWHNGKAFSQRPISPQARKTHNWKWTQVLGQLVSFCHSVVRAVFSLCSSLVLNMNNVKNRCLKHKSGDDTGKVSSGGDRYIDIEQNAPFPRLIIHDYSFLIEELIFRCSLLKFI